MKERPVIFNAEMVRAILGGRKTQARRVIRGKINQHPDLYYGAAEWNDGIWMFYTDPEGVLLQGHTATCPYGMPGDRLWVRETWLQRPDPDPDLGGIEVKYRATDKVDPILYGGWKPSIHMPRWASRITLELTGVRAERVQDITPKDAVAEGISPALAAMETDINAEILRQFQLLWDSINAKRGFGWDTNPWVWVLEFGRAET